MKYLWSEDSKLNEGFKAYSFGIKQDWCLIDFEWKLQLAQIECLFSANILNAEERDTLNKAVLTLSKEFQFENMQNAPRESDGFEDIHSFVESKICEIVGDLGKKIHTGRSRNDQVATLIKLYPDHKVEEVISLLTNLCENLSTLTEQYEKKPMPITTHFQQAALGSIDHYLEMRKKSFWVAREDLIDLRKKIMNECPLGSGACVGSSIYLDRNILSKELGFDTPSSNSLYSTSSRDEILDFSFTVSKLSLSLQNFIGEFNYLVKSKTLTGLNCQKSFVLVHQ